MFSIAIINNNINYYLLITLNKILTFDHFVFNYF